MKCGCQTLPLPEVRNGGLELNLGTPLRPDKVRPLGS